MKNLKRLGATAALTFVLAVAAFAGEIPTGPCAPPEPGEMNSPPCAAAQMTPGDYLAPGETSAPPASNAGDAYSVTEVAIDLLQSVLSIF
jgi:hypothetical protein